MNRPSPTWKVTKLSEARMLKPSDIVWSRQLFDSLVDGGMWAVPRSGLVFHRRSDRMVLTDRMPYTTEMAHAAARGDDVPPDVDALWDYQQKDFDLIAMAFRAAGVEVVDRTERTEESK